MYTLKTEINTTTDSMTIAGIETLLNIIFIASQNKRESIYSKLSK